MSGVADGQRETSQSGGESAGRELTLASDVEQTGAQSERNCEPGERERRRLVENLPESVGISPGSLEQQAIHRRRRLAVAENQQIAADERDEQRDERRNERLFGALTPRAAANVGCVPAGQGSYAQAALPFLVPIMYSPRASSLASAAGITTANLPRYITAIRSESASTSLSSALTRRIALPFARASQQLLSE